MDVQNLRRDPAMRSISGDQRSAAPGWPMGGGEMGDRIRRHDWSATPLGPIATWPHELRSALTIGLGSCASIGVLCGSEFILLYNDHWAALIGDKHPFSLGRPAQAVFPEIWATIVPALTQVLTTGEPFGVENQRLPLDRRGVVDASWFDVTVSPVRDDAGKTLGIFVIAAETTDRILAETSRRDGARQHRDGDELAAPLAGIAHSEGSIRTRSDARAEIRARKDAQERLRASEAFLRRVLASSEDCIKVLSLDGHLELMSEGGQRSRGSTDTTSLLGRFWPDLFVPADRDKAREAIANAASGRNSRFEGRTPRGTDEPCWWDSIVTPIPGADGAPEKLLALSRDISERRRAGERVAKSEQRFRSLLEGIPQLVWQARGSGDWTWASPQWTTYTGLSDVSSRAQGWLAALHPDDRVVAVAAWERAQGTSSLDVEYRIRRADGGGYRWFTTHAKPLPDGTGGEAEWLGASTDIHELRSLQDRQEALVAELQHRTRNLITVIRVIAVRTLRTSATQDEFWARCDDRLRALSRVQDLLARGREHDVTLEELVRAELDVLARAAGDERIAISGPVVALRRSAVQTLALALHELATNALKHGALASPAGRLNVTWQVRELEGDGRHLVVRWTERNLDPHRDGWSATRRGYGRELLERSLPYQLDARTSYELDEDGVRCVIDLPLEPRRAARDADR